MNQPPAILVLCTGNSCRSHIAEGILKSELGGEGFRIESAGSKPAGYVHPLAIRALAEIGIDISHHRSKHLDEFLNDDIEFRVRHYMGAAGIAAEVTAVSNGSGA